MLSAYIQDAACSYPVMKKNKKWTVGKFETNLNKYFRPKVQVKLHGPRDDAHRFILRNLNTGAKAVLRVAVDVPARTDWRC